MFNNSTLSAGNLIKTGLISLIAIFALTVNGFAATKVKRVVDITSVDKNGLRISYVLSDSTERGEQKGDGIIDFANLTREIKVPDRGVESQIPKNVKFPVVVKFIYFHKGNEVSNNHNLSREEWFSSFHGKIVECRDAYGNLVLPEDGEFWLVYSASEAFMTELQKMYEIYY